MAGFRYGNWDEGRSFLTAGMGIGIMNIQERKSMCFLCLECNTMYEYGSSWGRIGEGKGKERWRIYDLLRKKYRIMCHCLMMSRE